MSKDRIWLSDDAPTCFLFHTYFFFFTFLVRNGSRVANRLNRKKSFNYRKSTSGSSATKAKVDQAAKLFFTFIEKNSCEYVLFI
jgi:hypothetical protein